jgi:hypothetical protein
LAAHVALNRGPPTPIKQKTTQNNKSNRANKQTNQQATAQTNKQRGATVERQCMRQSLSKGFRSAVIDR